MTYRQELMRIDDRLAVADRLIEQMHHAIDGGGFHAAADFALQAKQRLCSFLKDNDVLVFGRPKAGVADAELMLDEVIDAAPILDLRAHIDVLDGVTEAVAA